MKCVNWKFVSVVLAVGLVLSLFVGVSVWAAGGDIVLDDVSTFDGNVTVSGLGSFGSVVSGQGLYPLVTIYNGSLPQIVPIICGVGTSEVSEVYYAPYYSENDTLGELVDLNGSFKYFDYVSVYGNKVFITGRNYLNVTWFKVVYTNGTTFRDWDQLP